MKQLGKNQNYRLHLLNECVRLQSCHQSCPLSNLLPMVAILILVSNSKPLEELADGLQHKHF